MRVACSKSSGLLPIACCCLSPDVSKSISKSFGVLIDDPTDGDYGVALRATAIVDPKGEEPWREPVIIACESTCPLRSRALSGVLRSLSVNDLPVGRNPDEVLRQVQVRACLGI